MKQAFQRFLSDPSRLLGGAVLVSVSALATAYIAELAFHLPPCPLCLYQRAAFAAVIALGVAGLGLRRKRNVPRITVLLCGLAFLTGSAIASYHSGIERRWWRPALEGCAAAGFSESQKTMLETILRTPAARCDEIVWADPVLGLTMANYNAALCFGLFMLCLAGFLQTRREI